MTTAADFSETLVPQKSTADALPYFDLKRQGKILDLDSSTATIDRRYLVDLMWPMLRMIHFDEDYYRAMNKDLREAEARGDLTDLYSHYVNFGFFENRLPCAVEVDGSFYARAYPDVAVAVLENRVPSCQNHFETTGFAEGRLPRKGWRFAELLQD